MEKGPSCSHGFHCRRSFFADRGWNRRKRDHKLDPTSSEFHSQKKEPRLTFWHLFGSLKQKMKRSGHDHGAPRPSFAFRTIAASPKYEKVEDALALSAEHSSGFDLSKCVEVLAKVKTIVRETACLPSSDSPHHARSEVKPPSALQVCDEASDPFVCYNQSKCRELATASSAVENHAVYGVPKNSSCGHVWLSISSADMSQSKPRTDNRRELNVIGSALWRSPGLGGSYQNIPRLKDSGNNRSLETRIKACSDVDGCWESERAVCSDKKNCDCLSLADTRHMHEGTDKALAELALFSCFGRFQSSGEMSAKEPSLMGKQKLEDCDCESKNMEVEIKSLNKCRSKRSRAAESHNFSEKRRRNRINEKLKTLQGLIPNSCKTDKASILDEAIKYLRALQSQLQMMSERNGRNFRPAFITPAGLQNFVGSAPSLDIGIGFPLLYDSAVVGLGLTQIIPGRSFQSSSATSPFHPLSAASPLLNVTRMPVVTQMGDQLYPSAGLSLHQRPAQGPMTANPEGESFKRVQTDKEADFLFLFPIHFFGIGNGLHFPEIFKHD